MTARKARMLTVADVADELVVSADHVRRLIRRRDLAAVNIAVSGPPNYRISRAALDRYLSDHAVAS